MMIDAFRKWPIAVAFASAALLAAACDTHSGADTGRPSQIVSAGIAAKGGGDEIGTDQSVEDSNLTTLVRGEVVAHAGEFVGSAGKGRFLKCDISPASRPLGRRTIGFDPATGSVPPAKDR